MNAHSSERSYIVASSFSGSLWFAWTGLCTVALMRDKQKNCVDNSDNSIHHNNFSQQKDFPRVSLKFGRHANGRFVASLVFTVRWMFNSNPPHLISKPDALPFTLVLLVLACKRLKTVMNFRSQRVVNAYETCLLDSSPAANLINPDSRGLSCEYDFACIGGKRSIAYIQWNRSM